MIQREIEKSLIKAIKVHPVTVLLGPRQVGKTTLAKTIKDQIDNEILYLDLEIPSDYQKLQEDPYFFLKNFNSKTVIIDEVQIMPELFPIIRSLVDQDRKAGRFILLGSASNEISRSTSESLAGRARYIEMQPITISEIKPSNCSQDQEKIYNHILSGGFPDSYLAPNDEHRKEWFDGFISSYIQRDLRTYGLNENPVIIQKLITMLAGLNGELINYSKISAAIGLSQKTVKDYINFLEQAFIIRTLLPFQANIKKRLIKKPKVYFRDTGLLNYLLGIYNKEMLLTSHHIGKVFESYVLQQIIPNLNYQTTPFFYKTQDGAELDLCLTQGEKVKMCLEFKFANNPKLTRGNFISRQDLGNPDLLVITADGLTYQKSEKVHIINVKDLPKLESLLNSTYQNKPQNNNPSIHV